MLQYSAGCACGNSWKKEKAENGLLPARSSGLWSVGLGLRLFLSLVREFVCHGLVELLSIYSVAFGGVHKNVVAARGGSLIGGIQQADFQKQLAKFPLIIRAYLLGLKFLRGRGVLLCLY